MQKKTALQNAGMDVAKKITPHEGKNKQTNRKAAA